MCNNACLWEFGLLLRFPPSPIVEVFLQKHLIIQQNLLVYNL